MDYKELLNDIKIKFPDKAIDMVEALELLRMVINDTNEIIDGKLKRFISDKQYGEMTTYSDMANKLTLYEKKIEDIISFIDLEENEPIMDEDEEDEKRTIPDYAEYVVDQNIEHSLYENFTHKRPYGFRINSQQLIETSTWKEMLGKLSELLITIDEEKFMGFENRKNMNGKKRKYFSVNPDVLRKPRVVANKIYIETNQSSNSIRNLIIKLLKEYDFSINQFKVYLKADYTSLNE